MKQILPQIKPLDALCGKQKSASGTLYRRSVFCMQVSCDDGVLLYHTLLGELLLLTQEEAANMLTDATLVEELKRKWFLVPQDFDDCKFSDQSMEVARLMIPPPAGITTFTIFTTTDCNARCFYCYEKGRPRRMMTEQTAHDIAAYMLRVSNGQKLHFNWFGGEPLFNAAAIDTIVRDVKAAGREFYSSMTSNAYLFDESMVQKAATEWNLKNVQVTLDGTEEVYNRTKAFIYRDGVSAFSRVMNAIDLLTKAGILVLIRLNVDRANADDVMALTEILAARFGGRKEFSVYAHLLFDDCGKHNFANAQEELACIMALNAKLDALKLRGRLPASFLMQQLKVNCCMADGDYGFTILPDGRLGKCEHYTEDHLVGSIYSENLDQEMLKAFKVRRPPVEACRSCAYYPLCRFLKLCAPCGGHPCTEIERFHFLENLRQSIRAAYRNSLTPDEGVAGDIASGAENC